MAAKRFLLLTGVAFLTSSSLALVSSEGGAGELFAPVTHAAPMLPAGAVSDGPMDSSTELHVSVVLRSSDPAALEQSAIATSTPGSASYRHFLAPSEVEQRFGPSADTLAAVRSWLGSDGLAVQPTIGDGLDVPAVGTAAQVEATFHTGLDHAVLASGRDVYVNTSPPEVPASLQPAITAVLGLDDLVVPQPIGPSTASSPQAASQGTLATAHGPSVPGAATPCAGAAGAGGQTADLIAQRYGLTPFYQEGVLGQGMTIGLLEQETADLSHLATYDQCYGISTNMTTVPVDGGATTQGGEAGLDLQTVTGLAPEAHIIFYSGPSSSFANFLDILATMVQQDQAQVLSTSFAISACEADIDQQGTNTALAEAPLFQEMALQGQTMLAAAGDAGSAACSRNIQPGGVNNGQSVSPYTLAVGDPASQPFVTAIGGTEVGPSGTEVVWNQSGAAGDGSGWEAPFDGQDGRPNGYTNQTGGAQNTVGTGGISGLWAMPPWQVGFDTSGLSSGSPCGAPAGSDCREVPDASALAAGIVVFGSSGWTTSGGTSAASPEWAAVVALIDQVLPQGRLGLISPSLYQIERNDPAAFFDVTQGNNNFLAPNGTPNDYLCTYNGFPNQPCYESTPGYDMTTGLGTPDAVRLAADLGNGGYWLGGADGGIYAFGDRAYFGSMGGQALTQPVVGVAGAPDGRGYWEVAADGGIFAFGAVGFYGSMGGQPLNKPVVGLAPTADLGGYREVASDGGVFCFGAVAFYGSMGGKPLNKPIVGIASTPDGQGYWEVASDGGVFTFGDAGYYGSMGGRVLNNPVVGIATTPDGHGYWEVASDGGSSPLATPVTTGRWAECRSTRPSLGSRPPSEEPGTGRWPLMAGSSPSAARRSMARWAAIPWPNQLSGSVRDRHRLVT